MQSLEERTTQADSILAPYAVKHGEGLGRVHEEKEDPTRLRFQRDRGRIVHTQEFRRLKGKTQVFVGGGGDHYRTRLTHTMEVAGISRDIARTLQLNEDLAECIALAHDIGHPPFGHAGEAALNDWMKERGEHFEHNEQSYRIVTQLAEHSSLFKGLNLNQEILEGLRKHSTPHDHPHGISTPHSPSLEAQVVNMADEISYTAHDCEDGLRAGLFTLTDLSNVPLAQEALRLTDERDTSLRGSIINLLVTDLYAETEKNMVSHRITTLDDVYKAPEPVITFSQNTRPQLNAFREFLWEYMYNHKQVLQRAEAGKQVVQSLCNFYVNNPTDKIAEFQSLGGGSIDEAVKDYVCGMTDSYAFLQAEQESLLSDDADALLAHH